MHWRMRNAVCACSRNGTWGNQKTSHQRLLESPKNSTIKRLTNGSEYAILPELQQTDAKLRKSYLPNELLSLPESPQRSDGADLRPQVTYVSPLCAHAPLQLTCGKQNWKVSASLLPEQSGRRENRDKTYVLRQFRNT